MDLLITQGKVIYVGSSNFAAWHIVAANEAARQRNTFGLVSEQSLYNLNTGAIELEVISAVRPTESGSCLGALWGEDSSPDRSLRPRRVGGQRTV
jgi:aryl-alcohol dehydrogenase-like predicted oxidoreductase